MLVQLPNRISFVIVFFALSKIGAVPIMMLPAHREAELEGIIELAKRPLILWWRNIWDFHMCRWQMR